MKRKPFICMSMAIAAMMMLCISGCGANHVKPNQVSVSIEKLPSKGIAISRVTAYEQNGELIIKGNVKRTFNNCCDAERGHIDIAVTAPDTAVVDVVSTLYIPRDIPRVRGRFSHFTAHLPYMVPEDAVLRITYHENTAMTSSVGKTSCPVICDGQMKAFEEG